MMNRTAPIVLPMTTDGNTACDANIFTFALLSTVHPQQEPNQIQTYMYMYLNIRIGPL